MKNQTQILRTNKQVVEIINNNDGTIQVLDALGEQIHNVSNFIFSMGGVESILSKCEPIEGTFADYMEAKKQALKIEAKKKAENQALLVKEAYKIIENEESTIQEVYKAFQSIRKIDCGWFACDKTFLENKKMKAFLLANIGSYTVTPFDNGEVIIKGAKGKYSNIRHSGYKLMYELFEVKL